MDYYTVKNWHRFQHYKDRNPPWIKLHYEIMTSSDWVMLADASKLLAVVCMLIASRNGGKVPADPHYFKRVAYLEGLPDFKPLIDCGFLEIPLADASNSKQEKATARPEAEPYSTETEQKESCAAVSDFQKVFDAGCGIFPQLAPQNTSSIHSWLSAGCSIDLDIIPELKRHAGRPIKSWGYFTGCIMDAKATREKPPPIGKPRGYQKPKEPQKANVITL